ncbi:RecT family recombinase [Alkalihalobacillus sp. FSL W8-0930]
MAEETTETKESKETTANPGEQKELSQTTGGLLNFSQDQVENIRKTVAKGASNAELEMFLHLSHRYQLDPLAKEIWFIKRPKKVELSKGKWDFPRLANGEIDYSGIDPIIMASRDGYTKIAQKDPEFLELNSCEIRLKDKFSFNPMTKEIQHEISSERGLITGAWAICKKKGKEPAVAVVDFAEYRKAVGKNPVWDNYPSRMITKVAEVIVLKRLFNISGLVTEEEMPREYSLDYDDPNLKRLSDNHPHKDSAIDPQQNDQKNDQKVVDEEWKQASQAIKQLKEQLGLDEGKMHSIVLFDLAIDANPRNWNLADIKKVEKHLRAELAKKNEETPQNTVTDDPFINYEHNAEPPPEGPNE